MPTEEQYGKAILLAQRAGDKEAADALINEFAAQRTGPAGRMAQMGAGMMDLVVGGKQLLGMADKDEVRSHNEIADMATGGKLGGQLMRGLGAALPAIAIPGAGTVGGAAAIGAGQGLLMPTEDESTFLGKAKNAALGGLAGGVAQKAINVASPYVGSVLKKALQYGPGGIGRGARQAAAEEAFTGAIPEAERAAAQQALSTAASQRTGNLAQGVSGAPITSGSAIAAATPAGGAVPAGAKALMATEREALDTGGRLGDPIRNLYDEAGRVRWDHLTQELGGDVGALARNKNDVYQNFLLNAKMRRPFDPKDRLWDDMQSALMNEHNPALKSELERIAKHYLSAKSAGDFQSLHGVRMEAFDDALARLADTDTKAANSLRNIIGGFKTTFDKEMERSLGPGQKWSKFLDEYSQAATEMSQAEAGNKYLGTLAAKRKPSAGGVPDLRGAQASLGTEAARLNKFDDPLYSQGGRDALETVRGEINTQSLPYEMGPRGSATAQNLNPSTRVLAKAIKAQEQQPLGSFGDMMAMTLGAVGAGPGGAVALPMARRALQGIGGSRAVDIAERLIQLHVDPARAAQVLANSGLPPGQVQQILQIIGQRSARIAAPMTSDMATTQPEQ